MDKRAPCTLSLDPSIAHFLSVSIYAVRCAWFGRISAKQRSPFNALNDQHMNLFSVRDFFLLLLKFKIITAYWDQRVLRFGEWSQIDENQLKRLFAHWSQSNQIMSIVYLVGNASFGNACTSFFLSLSSIHSTNHFIYEYFSRWFLQLHHSFRCVTCKLAHIKCKALVESFLMNEYSKKILCCKFYFDITLPLTSAKKAFACNCATFAYAKTRKKSLRINIHQVVADE